MPTCDCSGRSSCCALSHFYLQALISGSELDVELPTAEEYNDMAFRQAQNTVPTARLLAEHLTQVTQSKNDWDGTISSSYLRSWIRRIRLKRRRFNRSLAERKLLP